MTRSELSSVHLNFAPIQLLLVVTAMTSRPVNLDPNEVYDAACSCGDVWGAGPATEGPLMTDEEVTGIAELARRWTADPVPGTHLSQPWNPLARGACGALIRSRARGTALHATHRSGGA